MGGMNEILFLGGRACLDLCNTLRGRNDYVLGQRDLLADREALADWFQQAEEEADWLTPAAPAGDPTEAEWQNAVALREAVHDLSLGNVRQSDIDTVNRLAVSGTVPALSWDGKRFSLTAASGPVTVPQVLGLIAADAVDLFATTELDRIKECAQPRCGMLFLDTSRGNRRRWCSMATCGNRAKVKRFDDRARATSDRKASN